MENKILIHADINLNVVDGATIWWSNTINVFIQGGIDIIYISNYKITNDSNLRNIENKSKLKVINPDKNLNPIETLKKIEEYGNNVNKIILRSKLILDIINENWNLLSKTIIYGLDIHLNSIKKLNNKFKKVWTQSEQVQKLFQTNGINKVKIVPIVAYNYNFNLPKRNDNEIRLIYTGTLRHEENTIEIIEEFQKIHKERPEVLLKICYGKIHGDSNFINKVNTYIKNGVKGITFKHNLSHKDTSYEIATSDIGICWRKNGWGDNGEISTKIKEYNLYNLEICNTEKYLISIKYLNIAVILDEFSYNSMCDLDNIKIYQIDKNNLFNIFKNIYVTYFYCESAWCGLNNEWKGSIYSSINFKFDNTKDLMNIINYCKLHNKKTIFVNKEDPAHYNDKIHNFVKTSMFFDEIYTTSFQCIKEYKKDYNKDVKLFNFSVNTKIFNPIKKFKNINNTITFFGGWYSYFPNRCNDMIKIFDSIITDKQLNIEIYNRYYNNSDINHIFPEKYNNYIKKNVDVKDIPDIIKKSKYSLTINSVQDDDTMMARRIHEINLCNILCISNYNKGISNVFNNTIFFIENNNELIEFKKMNNIKYNLCCLINLYKSLNFSSKNIYEKIFNINNKNIFKSYIILPNKLNTEINIYNHKIINNISEIEFNSNNYIFLSSFPQSMKIINTYINHFDYLPKNYVLCITDDNENYIFENNHKINMSNQYIFPINYDLKLDNINIYKIPSITLLNIIITSYNCENKYIDCINALNKIQLNSMFYNLLFIDDNSSDNTICKLNDFLNENKIIIKLNKNSGSPSKPRNIGINLSKSKLLLFNDIDDEIIPDMINEKIIIDIISNDYNIVRFPLLKRINKNQKNNELLTLNKIYIQNNNIIDELIEKQSTTIDGYYNLIFLNKNNIRFDETIMMSEDTLFIMEIYDKSNKNNIHYIDFPIYIYNNYVQDYNNLSSTQNYTDKKINDHLYVIKKMNSINKKWYTFRLNIFIKNIIESLIYKTNNITITTFNNIKKIFNENLKNIEFNFIERYLDIINIIKNGTYNSFIEIIKPRLLISGFDFKFINELTDLLIENYNIKFDKWDGHDLKSFKIKKNEDCIELKDNLKWADIIFCEWMLGNAVFYSNNKYSFQKLFIRCHRFELTRKDYKNININNVNKIICVSPYYERLCNEITNFSKSKIIYIPNFIDTKKYDYSSNIYNKIAIVGILPIRKNLFNALEIINKVKNKIPNIELNIYGKEYKECTWLINDNETIKYFEKCNKFSIDNNIKVNYNGFQNLKKELSKNDFVLSVSEKEKIFESFHIAPAEGFVSGCISLFTDWYGVDEIYPNEYIFKNIDEIAKYIIDFYQNKKNKKELNKNGYNHIINNYDINIVKDKFKILFSE